MHFEFALRNLSRVKGGDEGKESELASKKMDEAIVSFYDTPVNFPEKAERLAEALLDKVLNDPSRQA
ncbi:hypothetical protein PHSC3_000513 [Chlamydiales bacterium STE3]|nr:hypothetical protein PHSC3_000513 [Chlamydiales bacterium STE3]